MERGLNWREGLNSEKNGFLSTMGCFGAVLLFFGYRQVKAKVSVFI